MIRHRSFLVHRGRQPSADDAGAPIGGGDAVDFANDDGSWMRAGGGGGVRAHDAVVGRIGGDLPIHRCPLQPQDLASRVTDQMTSCHHHRRRHPMDCWPPIPSRAYFILSLSGSPLKCL